MNELPHDITDIIYKKLHKLNMIDVCNDIKNTFHDKLQRAIKNGEIKSINMVIIKNFEDIRRSGYHVKYYQELSGMIVLNSSNLAGYYFILLAEACARYSDTYPDFTLNTLGRIIGYEDKEIEIPYILNYSISQLQEAYRLYNDGRIGFCKLIPLRNNLRNIAAHLERIC